MTGFLQGLREGISGNLSALETAALLVLAVLAWLARKQFPILPVIYSVFLVLYITLLRRAPGYDEEIRWHLSFWSGAGLWAGNLLNLALFLPLGWTATGLTKRRAKGFLLVVLCAFALSFCCETAQYLLGRGQADSNDIFFNTLGAAVGAVLRAVWS